VGAPHGRDRRGRGPLPHPRIFVTPGEPAGIGPDIVLLAAARKLPAQIVAVADPTLLRERAKKLKLRVAIEEFSTGLPRSSHRAGRLPVVPVALRAPVRIGQLDPVNASYVLDTLRNAASLCEITPQSALVTGPVHKGVINDAGITFTGHTEFLAQLTGVAIPVMMLATKKLRVALATTHLALRDVPAAITAAHLKSVLRVLAGDLQKRFGLAQPRILVAGLNPHSGEQGHLGREEIDQIEPALAELRAEGLSLTGPLPADTLFTPKYLRNADAVLAMYHDQGLGPIKAMHPDAVNVTLGLPFVRTSPDHGTAFDIAGKGVADPKPMIAAVRLAIEMCRAKRTLL